MVGVDVGGTFTDVVSVVDGNVVVTKVPTDVASSDRSVLEGAGRVDVSNASIFNLASTAGLNAVITRKLPKVAFLVTRGHRDVLDAGTIARPVEFLTDPTWHRSFSDASRPVVPRYLRREITERVTASGEVFIELDEAQAREELRLLAQCGVAGVAILLFHSHLNDKHESRLRELVYEELGPVECSISSEVSPLPNTYKRASTTVIDLMMKILYGEYTARLASGLTDLGFEGKFNYADCRAMLLPANYALERPFRLVAGGPAAGTVSCAHFGASIDERNMICADVGGTSCDISVVIEGQPWVKTSFDLEHDLGVNALSVDIITLGAGGGSVVSIGPTGDVRVGPESAGAKPGPACYDRDGTAPTMTDTALLIGILDPDGFLGGEVRLEPQKALEAFENLDSTLSLQQRISYAWRIGLNNIAEGLLNIATRRGIDPREFTLMAYGAAGPMELPSMLDLVPLGRVVVPPHPGLFSALGLVSADQVYIDERGADFLLVPDSATAIEAVFKQLEARLLDVVPDDVEVRLQRTFDARLMGQGFDTPFVEAPATVTPDEIESMVERFHDVYEARNGNRFGAIPVLAKAWRVQAVVEASKVVYPALPLRSGAPLRPRSTSVIRYLYDEDIEAPRYARSDLRRGDSFDGPAVVVEDLSTTFVPVGCTVLVGEFGELEITKATGDSR